MEKKITTVSGLGPNEVQIISMIFPSFEDAVGYVTGILGEPDKLHGYLEGTEDYRHAFWDVDFEASYDKDKEEEDQLDRKFFTSYYGGCGECSRIFVEEVSFGKPLVAFNLD